MAGNRIAEHILYQATDDGEFYTLKTAVIHFERVENREKEKETGRISFYRTDKGQLMSGPIRFTLARNESLEKAVARQVGHLKNNAETRDRLFGVDVVKTKMVPSRLEFEEAVQEYTNNGTLTKLLLQDVKNG